MFEIRLQRNQLQQLRKQLVLTVCTAILRASSGNPLLFEISPFWFVLNCLFSELV